MTDRHGTFSSSNNWKLMAEDKKGGFGAPAKKYIKQVGYELMLGRPINRDTNAKPTSWGKLVERHVFDMIGLQYSLVSQDRLFHKELKFWSGAPDLIFENGCADIKCPYSLEVFCDKIEALKDIETYKAEFPEDYWQHISNAILLEQNGHPVTHFEAIVYCPYKEELSIIRDMANNYDGNQNNIAFMNWADDQDLPYLIEGGHYKNLNTIRFEVTQEDKNALTDRVKEAGKLLIKQPALV